MIYVLFVLIYGSIACAAEPPDIELSFIRTAQDIEDGTARGKVPMVYFEPSRLSQSFPSDNFPTYRPVVLQIPAVNPLAVTTAQSTVAIVEEDDGLDFPHSPITSKRATLELQRLSHENRRMGNVICALMDRAVVHGHCIEALVASQDSLRADHAASILVQTFRTNLEVHKTLGSYFQNLHSQLCGQLIEKDYVARFGGLVAKPDNTELAISITSGAISAIPLPGSAAVGSVFAIAAGSSYQKYKENRRKVRQINLKTKESAEDVVMRLSIGLTYMYKNQIPLMQEESIDKFNAAIVDTVTRLLSTHIVPGNNIVTFLLGAIPYYNASNPTILLRGGEKIPLSYLLTHTGLVSEDGHYFLPILTRHRQNAAERIVTKMKEKIVTPVEEEFGDSVTCKNHALLSFRLSPVPLVRLSGGVYIHPLDRHKHPYMHYLQAGVDAPKKTIEVTEFEKIQQISQLTPDRAAIPATTQLGQRLISIESRTACLAIEARAQSADGTRIEGRPRSHTYP
jgi:hypothetical protein